MCAGAALRQSAQVLSHDSSRMLLAELAPGAAAVALHVVKDFRLPAPCSLAGSICPCSNTGVTYAATASGQSAQRLLHASPPGVAAVAVLPALRGGQSQTWAIPGWLVCRPTYSTNLRTKLQTTSSRALYTTDIHTHSESLAHRQQAVTRRPTNFRRCLVRPTNTYKLVGQAGQVAVIWALVADQPIFQIGWSDQPTQTS